VFFNVGFGHSVANLIKFLVEVFIVGVEVV
jgi:hypothetical protein